MLGTGSTALAVFLLLALPGGAVAAGLPSVSITTGGPIGDGAKRTARLVVGGPGGYRGPAGVELRGTSSMGFPKKSYAIETRTRAGEDRPVRLLGLPREDDFVLVAQWADQTRMRNALGYAASRAIGRWAAGTRYVELRVNGRPRGVYLLAERVELGRGRLAGGEDAHVLELADSPEPGAFRGPVSGRFYGFHDPDPDDLPAGRRQAAAAQVAALERALATGGEWRGLLDEAAAVDHVLLQELVKNNDAFSRSTFLVAGDGPLRLGPIWDLDRAMGDAALPPDGRSPEGWTTTAKPIAGALLDDPAFAALLAARWRAVRAAGLAETLDAQVVRDTRRLRAAVARDEGIWRSTRTPGHAAEVARLRSWLAARVAWIDSGIGAIGAA